MLREFAAARASRRRCAPTVAPCSPRPRAVPVAMTEPSAARAHRRRYAGPSACPSESASKHGSGCPPQGRSPNSRAQQEALDVPRPPAGPSLAAPAKAGLSRCLPQRVTMFQNQCPDNGDYSRQSQSASLALYVHRIPFLRCPWVERSKMAMGSLHDACKNREERQPIDSVLKHIRNVPCIPR